MEQQDNLAAAIAYFKEQSDLSPFAAQVAKWLTELKWHKEQIANMGVQDNRPLASTPPKSLFADDAGCVTCSGK